MSQLDTRSLFNRRQWRRRLRSLRPLLLSLAGVAVLAVAVWVVFFSSWLAADSVEVTGEETVAAADIVAAADVDLGTPLVRLDLDAIRERVSEVPAVAEVSVHRSWPHGVVIDITERQPLAAIRHDGSWWAMDAEGVLFNPGARRDPALPIVVLPARASDDARREAASVVAVLPAEVLSDVRRLTARTMDSITLSLKNRSEVKWGSAAESDRKVEVLALLLDKVKAAVYDVSVPEQPTTAN